MADRVDAAIDAMPPSRPHPSIDRIFAEAEVEELPPSHNPVLSPSQLSNIRIRSARLQ
jgi:hypothetical protein